MERTFTPTVEKLRLTKQLVIKKIEIHCSMGEDTDMFTSSSPPFGMASLQVRHKQDWGQGFILLLLQDVVLLVSDAGSDVVKLLSIEFCHPKPSDLLLHVVPDVCGTRLERGLRFVQRRRTRDSVKERDPICAWTNGIAQHQSSGN